jgi:DNA-binding protein YbaB
VTEPGLTPEQRLARVADLQQQADSAMATLRKRIAAAGEARDLAREVSGEATSQDGAVRVKVDSTGVVTALNLAPSAFDRSTPERLATTIVATIQKAATTARAGMTEAMAPLRAGGDQARAAMAGIPELDSLRFDVPEVPRTAVDPTNQDPWAATREPEPEEEPEPPQPPSPPAAPRPVGRRGTEAAAEDWSDEERPW